MDPSYATRVASQSAEQTKSASEHVPSRDEFLAGKAVDLKGANSDGLRGAIHAYSDAYFDDLSNALESVRASLKEPKQPDESVALKLIAGLVGTLSQLALTYLSAGLARAVAPALGAHITDAMKDAMKPVVTKATGAVETGVEHLLERENDRNKRGGEEPGEWMNPAAKELVDEFMSRQKSALVHRKAEVQVEQVAGAISRASSKELEDLALELQEGRERAAMIGRFQEQVVFGWMNFLTQVSLGKKDLVQPRSAHNAVEASPFNRDSGAIEASGRIDVFLTVPETVVGVQGISLKGMSTDAGPGAARTLKHRRTGLMKAPVVRRIWLVSGESKLAQTCPITLFPNGGISIDLHSGELEAIGKLVPVSRNEASSANAASSTVQMGAQLILNLLQQYTLEKLEDK